MLSELVKSSRYPEHVLYGEWRIVSAKDSLCLEYSKQKHFNYSHESCKWLKVTSWYDSLKKHVVRFQLKSPCPLNTQITACQHLSPENIYFNGLKPTSVMKVNRTNNSMHYELSCYRCENELSMSYHFMLEIFKAKSPKKVSPSNEV